VLCGCATIGSPGQGNLDLPNSGVGPFRKLTAMEMRGVAPLVLEDATLDFREPAALAVNPDDASSTSVYLYVVMQMGGADVIGRTRADDARSFFGTANDSPHHPAVVLSPDQAWEGGALARPSVLRAGGKVLLFYAAAGGIGMASSGDGLTFTKAAGPVLAPDASVAWETTTPAVPSVAALPDGRLRMLYASSLFIGEAESTDGGATWKRLDADPSTAAMDPVLGPGPALSADAAAAIADSGVKPPFDTAQVTDPCLRPRVTAAGRLQYRVLYTGYVDSPGTAGRNGTIGYAARYGDSGPLVRQTAPVYSVGKHERAPTVFDFGATDSMLYVEQDDTTATPPKGFAIAAAVAPATLTFDTPAPYASAP
jgi:hypothetical protein